jgi:hypothetical protein
MDQERVAIVIDVQPAGCTNDQRANQRDREGSAERAAGNLPFHQSIKVS